MTRVGRARASRALLAAAIALAVAGIGTGLGVAPATADDSGGVDLTVEVTAPGSGGTGSGTGGGTGGGSPTPTPTPTPEPTEQPDDDPVGGVHVGGAESGYAWSFDPFAGTLTVAFTVRNDTADRVRSAVRFTLDGPFGNRLDRIEARALDLAPGQSVVVRATLRGVGQWTYVRATVRLTPTVSDIRPASAVTRLADEPAGQDTGTSTTDASDAVELAPITRDRWILVPPWALLALAALLAAGTVLVVRFRPFARFGRAAEVVT